MGVGARGFWALRMAWTMLSSLLVGCTRRRVANQQYLVGAEAALVASNVSGGDEEQVVGGAYASIQVAETDEDWTSLRVVQSLADACLLSSAFVPHRHDHAEVEPFTQGCA